MSDHRTLERRTAAAALAVSVALAAVKFIAYGVTGSSAVFADALESIVNILAASLAVYAVNLAHRPPDVQHPYGHGKVEFVSAGFEGGAICIAAAVMAVNAADALVRRGVRLAHLDAGIVLIGVTMVANGGVGLLLLRLARRTGSTALDADGKHLISDSVTSFAAIGSLLVARITGWGVVDPILAVVMALWCAIVGWRLFRRAMGGLMDEQDSGDQQRILAILDSHLPGGGRRPTICSYHKVRHRHAGRYHWVDMHLRFPGALSVREAHAAGTTIEEELEAALGEANATAHVEPCGLESCPSCAIAPADPSTV